MSTNEKLVIAKALEQLVSKAIADFQFGMNVLRIPPSVQQPMWDALGRRAIRKAAEIDASVKWEG